MFQKKRPHLGGGYKPIDELEQLDPVMEIETTQERAAKQAAERRAELTFTEDDYIRWDKNRSKLNAESKPIVNLESSRIESILNDTPAIFEIAENPNADGSKPFLESGMLNPIESGEIYNAMAAKYGIDPDWLKAIAYMENTHGFYDAIPPLNLVNTSYRPMNVQYKTWSKLADELGFNEWQVQYRVECNVELGALILSRIIDRVPNPTIEKVASIYNYTGKENVSDYGMQVKRIYEERLWEN
ncbi:hypothetical protein SN11_16905 [Vibrio harveyi]|nr:hypothetical protein SN11_16905 [Vibrio harveyi]